MSALPVSVVDFELLRDSRHPGAKAAREQAAWLSWLELGGSAPATLYHYQWSTDKLLELLPDTEFAAFTDTDLMAALRKFPERSRKNRKAAFESWFKWGLKTRRLPVNPMDYLPDIKRLPQQVVEVFTPAEEGALTCLPAPDGQLMTLLFEGGLRKSEARYLQVKRLDVDQKNLYVMAGSKNGKQRVVPFSRKLAIAASELVLLEGLGLDDYVWGTRPGGGKVRHDQPMGETSFVRWWERCIESAGVTYRKPHTTRHTFATRWRKRGLALDDIQMLLGHASIQTTSDLYVHTKVSDIADKMGELGE